MGHPVQIKSETGKLNKFNNLNYFVYYSDVKISSYPLPETVKAPKLNENYTPVILSQLHTFIIDLLKLDCNEDGRTNCDDYSLINFNGGLQCQTPLDRNEFGVNWTRRYRQCNPTDDYF
ncbi:hypothetical protein NQ317_012549 [Molorchus minor]|uniref:Uncharacterized protein n=1 Tax=Molorchus minor TaxID=1323400 RepID=A0ABQ9K218_9CUCU|nr:hypothetical protein NQ317_012549 [Molorchus minor]